jgi:hypothetical protein
MHARHQGSMSRRFLGVEGGNQTEYASLGSRNFALIDNGPRVQSE